MPPPTIKTSVTSFTGAGAPPARTDADTSPRIHSPRLGVAAGAASQMLPHEIFKDIDEPRGRVQRFGPAQRGGELACGPRRLHVDVVQDLGMVADEPDRRDEKLAHATSRLFVDGLFNGRSDPRLRRPAGALIGDHVSFDPRARGDAARGRGHL